MTFVSFTLLTGESAAFNVNEIFAVCVAKKGVRLFLSDGSYYDVQGDYLIIVEELNKAFLTIEK